MLTSPQPTHFEFSNTMDYVNVLDTLEGHEFVEMDMLTRKLFVFTRTWVPRGPKDSDMGSMKPTRLGREI